MTTPGGLKACVYDDFNLKAVLRGSDHRLYLIGWKINTIVTLCTVVVISAMEID
jgi:hypothetical protein